ncbi:MAG: GIY-YIG nuclease family protein [Desulfobacterales bacterium]|nr:GIY-YIG nuclease family protein [Desulfobacterales bacterium]
MNEKQFYVYILTNWNNRVMYTGITSDLKKRIYQHQNKSADGFTQKYNVFKLVYFETVKEVRSAIAREKEIKGWRRSKKDQLVSQTNPEWKDLSFEL